MRAEVKHVQQRLGSTMVYVTHDQVEAMALGHRIAILNQGKLEPFLDRRPSRLSGGEQQRVALGRAMVRQPAAFLMDEPLSNLDAKLRVHMRSELAELHARIGTTFIYVTHDQVEAMTMSDRVAMMDNGEILQLGRPADLYARPANVRVAQFIGTPAINLLPAKANADGFVELFGQPLPLRAGRSSGSALTLGIRPESLTPAPVGTARPGTHALAGRLRRSENLGAGHILHVDLGAPGHGSVICAVAGALEAFVCDGSELALQFAPAACHVFDANGERVADNDAHTHAMPPAARIGALG
jgi:multiple sugar transport system ATP-binding protein